MPMQNFHRFSLNAAGLEPPLSKSRTRAPGLSPARDTIWGAQGFRVRLTAGLARTKINTDLCVDGTTAAYPRLPPVSYPAGRGLRWGANLKDHMVGESKCAFGYVSIDLGPRQIWDYPIDL